MTYRLARERVSELDPATYAARAKPFGSAVRDLGSVTLLTVRSDTGVDSYMVSGSTRADLSSKAAGALARAVGAKAEQVPQLPDLSGTSAVTRLLASPSQSASRDTQAGADPVEVAQTFARTAEPGSWVAVTLRKPTKREVDRARRWNRRRQQSMTHHSLDAEVLIASFYAGGPSKSSAKFLLGQVVAALPGMDVDATAQAPSNLPSVLAGAGLAGGLGAAAMYVDTGVAHLGQVSPEAHEVLAELPLQLALGAGAGVAGAWAVLAGIGLAPTAKRALVSAVGSGQFPKPATGGKKAPEAKPAVEGRPPKEPPNPYPLARSAFLVGPSVVAGVAAPQGGAESGAAATAMRGAPPALLGDIGPVIGTSVTGQDVHLSAVDALAGVMVLGIPGAGKSQMLRQLYGWYCLERVSPRGRDGWPGEKSTLIAFENKGDGAVEYLKWGRDMGDHPLLIDLADDTTPAIDLFAGPGDVRVKAKLVAEAMQYAFPAGDIRRQSLSTLTLVLAAAQLVDDEIAGWAGVPAGASVPDYAAVLLGSRGDAPGVALATALLRAGMERDDAQLRTVVGDLGPMYGDGKASPTPAQRRQLQDAPRTKIETLTDVSGWFSPGRPKLSWDRILQDHENVILNTGTSDSGATVSEETTSVMGAMLLFLLKESISRNCSGWRDKGRTTTVFADELSLLANSSPGVVAWMRNQGRSYGINLAFATQYPDQLHDELREAVLGFGTVGWFRQSNTNVAARAADMLSVDGSSWGKADIFNLPAYTLALATQVDKEAQPATMVKVADWESDRPSFPDAQGYVAGTLDEPVRAWAARTEVEVEPEPLAPVESAAEWEDDPFAQDV